MEFQINKSTKRRARRRRVRHEKKWLPLRVLSWVSLPIAFACVIAGMQIGVDGDPGAFFAATMGFTIAVMVFVVTRSLLLNLTSHWISDRLNERIWIEDGCLYHFIQTAFAAGLNYRHADERANLFVIDLSSIHDARYDSKSGRIEFKADGRGYHYADIFENRIDQEWELKGFAAVFYNYTEPSLYTTLCDLGVQFKIETLDFKIRDARI